MTEVDDDTHTEEPGTGIDEETADERDSRLHGGNDAAHDKEVDEQSDDSFPASDPPSY